MNIKIVEVGPRDGLQNQPTVLSPAVRAQFVELLYCAGFSSVEVASVVHPERVPQMAGAEELLSLISPPAGRDVSVLVPNLKGLTRIHGSCTTEISVFTAASDSFNQHNINTDIEGSLQRIAPLVTQAKDQDLRVRGTVSCIAKCPYEGTTSVAKVVEVCEALWGYGCDEIVLGDTIGAATPNRISEVIQAIAPSIAVEYLALHSHDTYDNAIANVERAISLGVSTVDAAAGGLGGCPFAPGAKGNVATRKVVDFCESQGLKTGIDLDALSAAEQYISQSLAHAAAST